MLSKKVKTYHLLFNVFIGKSKHELKIWQCSVVCRKSDNRFTVAKEGLEIMITGMNIRSRFSQFFLQKARQYSGLNIALWSIVLDSIPQLNHT